MYSALIGAGGHPLGHRWRPTHCSGRHLSTVRPSQQLLLAAFGLSWVPMIHVTLLILTPTDHKGPHAATRRLSVAIHTHFQARSRRSSTLYTNMVQRVRIILAVAASIKSFPAFQTFYSLLSIKGGRCTAAGHGSCLAAGRSGGSCHGNACWGPFYQSLGRLRHRQLPRAAGACVLMVPYADVMLVGDSGSMFVSSN